MTGRTAAALAALICTACSQPPPAESPSPAPQATDGAAPVAAKPVPPPPLTFDCGDMTVSVTSLDNAVRIGLPGDRQIVLPQEPAASGARYSNGAETFWDKGAEATLTVDGRTSTCRLRREPWTEARERGVDFRAIGQEPGWYLEIDSGRSMRLVYDYGEMEASAPAPPPIVTERRITYTARSGDGMLTVTIDEQPCQDGMSGQPFSHAVTVTLGSLALRGCGRSLAPRADGWAVSARGAGPVRIGMTRAQAEAAVGAPLEGGAGDSGAACAYLRSPASPDGLLFMLSGGTIARVDVTRAGVPTDAGVEVGSSETQVHTAYGPAVAISPHKYTDGRYLTVMSGANGLVFESDGQWVTRYRGGRVPEVEWVEGCS